MKNLLFFIIFIITANTFAATYKAKFVLSQGKIENIEDLKYLENHFSKTIEARANEMYDFFKKDEKRLQPIFPEFKIKDLLKKMKSTDFEIVDEVLLDKDGVSRACLNFPKKSKIKCRVEDLHETEKIPEIFFALMLHEYLGLMGIEETSIYSDRPDAGYSISSRIASSLTVLKGHDLVLKSANLSELESTMYDQTLTIDFIYDNLTEQDFLKFSEHIKSEITNSSIERSKKTVNSECRNIGKKVTFMDSKITSIDFIPNNKDVLVRSTVKLRYICD